MIARRLGAVLAAAALIVGAVFARRALDDEDAAADDDPPVDVVPTTLLCITELRAACLAVAADHPELEVTVEDAGRTLDRLAVLADPDEASLWATLEPFPAMVDVLRTTGGLALIEADVAPIAATRTAIALPSGARDDLLLAECADGALWRCVGDAAGVAWTEIGSDTDLGTVRPALGDVESSASALASFAAAMAGYFDDPDISRTRWEADPDFVGWLRPLARAVRTDQLSAGTPLATMVTRRGALDVAATTDAEAADVRASGQAFDIQYPEPSMWVEAVLAVPAGVAAPDDLATDLTAALTTWTPTDQAGTALPDAGTMIALRTLWGDAT